MRLRNVVFVVSSILILVKNDQRIDLIQKFS